ncbi:MAG: DUF262 domain-containing protein [Actinobacteria bacterium]|nr:DUF262 domain-containing protein [Actinomycetota bacterium]
MQAETVDVKSLFERDIRYLIPVFQRNYKWNESEHWAPLWVDLRNLATDLLEFGPGPDLSEHFLGAIVCEVQAAFGRDAQAVAVIDGQQRLTTVQLFLAAARRVCERRGLDGDAQYLRGLLENSAHIVNVRESHQYKIWPNVADRGSYVAAMRDSAGTSQPETATRFFEKQISRWLDIGDESDPDDDADHTPQERMAALIDATTSQMKLVKIDLQAKDNAQVIFETLNGRGERLTDADLIRNLLFRKADEQGTDVEALHSTSWSFFDEPRWSDQVAHGRHQRDRLHLFLNHWLSMKLLEEVPGSAVFRKFQEKTDRDQLPAEVVAKELRDAGAVFDSFDAFEVDSREWWFFRRIREMDLITVFPLLLWTFGQPASVLPPERRLRITRAVESYLVRRLISRASTRSYGRVFIDLLATAGAGEPGDSDARIVRLLADRTAEADFWPADDVLAADLRSKNAYGLRKSRIAMVLEAVERQLVGTGKTEFIDIARKSVEHILPQGWRHEAGWALPDGLADPTAAGIDRDRALHTWGNLTLVTWGKNSELSNHAWDVKKESLAQHTALQINRDLRTRWPNGWNETTINERADYLINAMKTIWPAPADFLEEVEGRE